ncbi:MAG: metal ABC transporter substrate-binding protein [Georgenia sp.]
MKHRAAATVATLLATTVTLAACGGGQTGSSDDDGGVTALASFYPLQYVTEQVGGDRVDVTSLTPPGAEPHDLELSPRAVAQLGAADLVVYLSGFQPAVDDGVEQTSPQHVVDAATRADLETAEPHLWLDPVRLGAVAGDVADALSVVDPDGAAGYAANAARLRDELAALDTEFRDGLASCERRTIVVSHEAFGYLAETYDLEQIGIAGLDPETEPSPARLAEIAAVVRAKGVTTVFTESLVSSQVAETLAADLGVAAAVLDPVEGLVDDTKDYQQVMRENLAALREALTCA